MESIATRRSSTQGEPDYLVCPFTIVIDSREQAPYSFRGLIADARHKRRPLIVRTEIRGLASGDYSLAGHEDQIAVERKSLDDLYATLGQGRERFERELVRLNELAFAAVVIEAGWSAIVGQPPAHSKLSPKSVYRSVIAWQQRFPKVHWWPCDTRTFAERTTFRILERFWSENEKIKSETAAVEAQA
jgi:ERCC4-type nuclease